MSRKIKNRFFISLCFIQNDKVFLYLLNERYKFTKKYSTKVADLCFSLRNAIRRFHLARARILPKHFSIHPFPYVLERYFFTVYHKRKFAKIWNILGFVLISSILLKYFDCNFYLKWLIVLILGFIYNADFLNINLRKFSLVKTFYVGFIWALSLVWFPLKEMNWAWFFIIFFYTSAITFPFEIRDLKRDDFTTLPMKIGIQNTKYLSYLFFFVISSVLAIIFSEIWIMLWLVLSTFNLRLRFCSLFFSSKTCRLVLFFFNGKFKRNAVYFSCCLNILTKNNIFTPNFGYGKFINFRHLWTKIFSTNNLNLLEAINKIFTSH